MKRAPMHGHAFTRAEIAVDLHGFSRVAVLFAHEPARFVGADRDEGEVRRAEAGTNIGEQAWVATGVADEIEPGLAGMEVKAAPEAVAAPSTQPVAPMLRGGDGDREIFRVRVVLPPVELDDPRESGADEQVTVAQWSDGEWIVDFCDPAERGQIAVVVMIVAEEYEMDLWQLLQRDARRMYTFGPNFAKRAATGRINRVGKKIALGRFD